DLRQPRDYHGLDRSDSRVGKLWESSKVGADATGSYQERRAQGCWFTNTRDDAKRASIPSELDQPDVRAVCKRSCRRAKGVLNPGSSEAACGWPCVHGRGSA